MGKGDRKTRRGKIYAGSFGKSRPKDPSKNKKKPEKPATKSAGSRK
jgi:30S ribosomal protein S31